MKKVALLFNLNRHQFEYETEFDSELTIDSIYNTLSKEYEVIKIEADKEFKWIEKLNEVKPDLVFNICEGYNGPARESVYAAILEQFNYNDIVNCVKCNNTNFTECSKEEKDFITDCFYQTSIVNNSLTQKKNIYNDNINENKIIEEKNYEKRIRK